MSKEPALANIPPELDRVSQFELLDGAKIERGYFSEVKLTGVIAKSVDFESSHFDKCEITSSKLRRATLTDLILDDCMLFASDFDESGWQRIQVNRGIMSGVVLSAALLKDITFIGVKMDLANFRFAKLKQVKFEDCDLTEADFLSAEMKDVVFSNCRLHKATFAQCKLQGVDLRGSQLDEIKGIQSLQGVTISSSQLFELSHDLAASIGIKVSDN